MKYFLGLVLILFGILVIGGTYAPILKEEINYNISTVQTSNDPLKVIEPVDYDFGIMIPKISANAKIIKDVNPFDPAAYQLALSQGVAHAYGSALPDKEEGNVFLFSHSSTDFFQATRFNAIFYLLSKLKEGDTIRIYYKKEAYAYKVTNKVTVRPDAIDYLQSIPGKKQLTLMTCWPPGTSINRLIVQAEILP